MVVASFNKNHCKYSDVRESIRTGDCLLWRPTNVLGRLIARYTDGPYSHFGSVSWAGDVLETHEQLQFRGGQTINLSAYVKRYSGLIDVYSPPLSHLQRAEFTQRQRRRAGEYYGWEDLGGMTVRTLTHDTVRMPWRQRLTDVNRETNLRQWHRLYSVPVNQAAFCSEAGVSDLRHVGADLLSTFAAWEVSPNMLAEVMEYRFTLIW